VARRIIEEPLADHELSLPDGGGQFVALLLNTLGLPPRGR